jgi:glycosyltransferase involved in cell wall biosynthesis
MRPLIVDPSARGGIARYTRLLAAALQAAGADPVVLRSRALTDECSGDVITRPWLPRQRWSRPEQRAQWPSFYTGRALAWLSSVATVELAVRIDRPDVVHFQAPINRRLDAKLVRLIGRSMPVVWTAHDVLPPEQAPGDEERFARIYRTVDVVIVHNEPAAIEVERIACVKPVVVGHVPDGTAPIDRVEARRRLHLPQSERILGAIGFIRSHKGYDLLAEVWGQLRDAAPLLLVIGEVVDEDAGRVVDRLDATDRAIVRRGYATDEDIQLAVSAVDGLLLPYLTASESGLLHLAQTAGVPVIASDAPQLAASVRERRGGSVLPRDVDLWVKAVVGTLPAAPAAPAAPEVAGRAHIEVYEESKRRARSRIVRAER